MSLLLGSVLCIKCSTTEPMSSFGLCLSLSQLMHMHYHVDGSITDGYILLPESESVQKEAEVNLIRIFKDPVQG
jgi:hypothetical protein